MSLIERISKIGFCVIQILIAIAVLIAPEYGYTVIFLFMIIIFCARGIGGLLFFFQLARFMVGGKRILYRGILFLDVGIVLMHTSSLPAFILSFSLAALLLYDGITWFLKARYQKATHIHTWGFCLVHSAIIVLGAVLCAVFYYRQGIVASIFAFDIIYEAILKIHDATKKTTVAFIQ